MPVPRSRLAPVLLLAMALPVQAQDDPEELSAAIPGLDSIDHRLGVAPLLREGTFLVDRRGSMVRLSTGEWAFFFHPDAESRADRPMLLLPCARLAAMAQIAEADPSHVVMVSGQVFAYRQRNYLLPTLHRIVPGGGVAAPAARDDGGVRSTEGEPTAEEIIRDLESRSDARRLAPRPIESPAQGVVPDPVGVKEGEFLFRRRARLARQPGGEWALVFDNDHASRADPPLIPLPCLLLEDLERSVSAAEDAVTIEVSGRVYVYAGRAYVILTLVRRERVGDVTPRQ